MERVFIFIGKRRAICAESDALFACFASASMCASMDGPASGNLINVHVRPGPRLSFSLSPYRRASRTAPPPTSSEVQCQTMVTRRSLNGTSPQAEDISTPSHCTSCHYATHGRGITHGTDSVTSASPSPPRHVGSVTQCSKFTLVNSGA